jgi:hypothetical protein
MEDSNVASRKRLAVRAIEAGVPVTACRCSRCGGYVLRTPLRDRSSSERPPVQALNCKSGRFLSEQRERPLSEHCSRFLSERLGRGGSARTAVMA